MSVKGKAIKKSNIAYKTQSRHKKLLESDADVLRWYNNLVRGSKLTADVNLRRLGLFCERNHTTPQQIIKIGQKNIKQLDDLLLDDVTHLENLGHAPSYIDSFLKTMRSWLSYNYIKTVRKIRIKNSDIPVTLEDEMIPTREQLDKVMNSATPRARTIICLMAFAGVRPEVLGMYRAVDGLKISDIEGLQISPDRKVSFVKIPAKVTVRRTLSKAGHQYFTFLPKIGCENLAGYLRERLVNGEIVTEDSPIITAKHGHYYNKETIKDAKFLNTATITKDVRHAFEGILKERPYVLRSYFDSHLLEAENNNRIAHAYRQFFMGHKGDIEARYTTNKKILSESMLTDMRKAYTNSLPYLLQEQENNTTSEKNKKEMFLEMWKEQAKMYGIDPMNLKIEKQRVTNLDDNKNMIDAIQQEILQKINPAIQNNQKQFQSKIVSVNNDDNDELLSFIEDGWEPVKELSCNRIIIKKKGK